MGIFDKAKMSVEKLNADKNLLRYMVVGSEVINSTAAQGAECQYIYIKPGVYNDVMGISNIDFAQEIYSQNGIKLKKHISHLDGKETEVLYIAVSDYLKLTALQQKFINDTAPLSFEHNTMDKSSFARSTELVNIIYSRKRQKSGK